MTISAAACWQMYPETAYTQAALNVCDLMQKSIKSKAMSKTSGLLMTG